MTETIERLRYFQRQYLGALDFEDEQEYHRDMRRRHNVGLHTWGIVTGLELEERPPVTGGVGEIEIWIRPGMAIDGYGRELVVLSPVQLDPDPALFGEFATSRYVEVWLTYDEERTRRPAPGYEQCDLDSQLGRVRERYRIVVGPQLTERDALVVAGRTVTSSATSPATTSTGIVVPADESAPFQELPDPLEGDLPARWLIRLGSVNWDGAPSQRRFVSADAAHLNEGRRYAGAVAGWVRGPAGRVEIGPRWQPPALAGDDQPSDVTIVHGPLRVQGERTAVRLYGGKLDFRSQDGGASPPLEVYRSASELRVRIGSNTTDGTSLAVGIDTGTVSAPAFDPKVTLGPQGDVTAKGTVHAHGDVRLNGSLDIRDATGGTDTDVFLITRHNRAPNQNDLRVVLGDDNWNDDRFVIGPVFFADGQFKENFVVTNSGATRIGSTAGRADLTIHGNLLVGSGGQAIVKTRHVDGKNWTNDDDDGLYLNWNTGKPVVVGGAQSANLEVNGDLRVSGSVDSVMKVFTETKVVTNDAATLVNAWRVDYPGEFTEVYTAFAVFQGFSIYPQTSASFRFWMSPAAPTFAQHAFVTVTDIGLNRTEGQCGVVEAGIGADNRDNAVLFTVVVLGRKV